MLNIIVIVNAVTAKTQHVDALLITKEKYFNPGPIEINDMRRCHLLSLHALIAG